MNSIYKFLQGGGQLGELIRNKDWTQTSFGSPDTWPDSLKSALSISLNSGFPIAVYWGADFSLLYNDAWSTIPGDKHPWALGKPGPEVWPELWEDLKVQFNSVLHTGESIRVPNALLPMNRYGYTEECYFDYTLSPIIDVNGQTGGVFNAVIETTYRFINERRNQLLHHLIQQLNVPHTFEAGVQQAMQVIESAREDIPFALLYTSFSANASSLKLSSAINILPEVAAKVDWPQAGEVMDAGIPVQVKQLPGELSENINNYWPEPCMQALIVPLGRGDVKITGYVVLGISPRKALDVDYQHFMESAAIHIATTINNGYAYEQEQLMINRIALSENRFRSMMEQAPVAMLVLRGKNMVLSKANRPMLELMGKSADVIGKPLREAMPELKGQSYWWDMLNQVYCTGKPYYGYDMPALLNRKGKAEQAYFDFSYTPLIEDGVITGILQVSNEVTEQVNAKRAVAESEALLRNITSASPAALWMSDAEGMITYVNQTWLEWTGLSYKDSLGTGWATVIVEEDRQRAVEKFLADLNARRYYEVSFKIIRQDGAVKWCLATGNPSFDEQRVFVGYIGACADITDKILNEQKLAETNEKLQHMVTELEFLTNSIPSVVWTSKPDGELDFINRRVYDENAQVINKALGNEWLSNVHPEDVERVSKAWKESVRTGNDYEIEFRIKSAYTDYRWNLVRALPMRDNNGTIIKWYGTNTDIHEQKVLERQKDNFLGVASHELKTPVTSIKAYAQVLETMFKREGDATKANMLTKLNGQINRLTSLIGDLLDVTKIHTGRLQFNDDIFDFSQLVEEITDDVQRTTEVHVITQRLNFKGNVYGDKDRISQVITNLLTNAIKYSPDADRIIIYTEPEGEQVRLCVQDFGIGISQEQCDRVFEQFYRVSGSKEHTFPGLGLGLYISSEIIKREGGRIWVNSIEGKGSTFCFSIPVNRLNSGSK